MRIVLLFVLLFLSGYTLAGDQDKTLQCLKGLEKDARFAPIKSHLALDGQDVEKPEMQADKSIPNEQQKRAIADWIDARSLCVNLMPRKIFVDQHLVFLSIVPDLYNGQASFGEFNKKWRTLFKEVSEASTKPQDPAFAHHHH